MTHPYADILNTPYPFPTGRPRMSEADRAAQFSPFAALVGYEESIAETGRLTSRRIELSEDAQKELNEKLVALQAHPEINATVTYFEPDSLKQGGAYKTVSGQVLRIDPVQKFIRMDDGTGIFMENLLKISFCE